MKSIHYVVLLALLLPGVAHAQQKHKKTTSKKPSKPASAKAPVTVPRIIGSQIVIVTKNGDRISGELLELTAYSARIKSGTIESTIALDTLESITFGALPPQPPRAEKVTPQPVATDFVRDADATLSAFASLASDLKAPIDYTEYGRRVSDLRRLAERFLVRNATPGTQGDPRVTSLLWAALSDYGWARTIWTLKFGRSSEGTASETESPTLADALAAYPDIAAQSANGDKYVIDKVVTGLWKKAAEKVDRARSLLGH